jgi:hypothetical protein
MTMIFSFDFYSNTLCLVAQKALKAEEKTSCAGTDSTKSFIAHINFIQQIETTDPNKFHLCLVTSKPIVNFSRSIFQLSKH